MREPLPHTAGDHLEASAPLSAEPAGGASAKAPTAPVATADLSGSLAFAERELILDALRAGNGDRRAAAERLGISPRTLRYKLARLRDAGVDIP